MKVLITGGTGLLGRFLVEKCMAQGYEVEVLANRRTIETPGVKYTYANITSLTSEDLATIMKGTYAVCHLAAEISIPGSYAFPELYYQTNTIGTLKMVMASRLAGVEKFIQTSTSEVYGTAQTVPITEDHPINPQSPYAASKASADYVIQSFSKSFNFPGVILRPFNMFGEYQSQKALIPSLIVQVLTNDQVKVGNLNTYRDFTHASDTADAYIKVIERVDFTSIQGKVLNVSSNNCIMGKDILLSIIQTTGRKVEVVEDPIRVRPKDSEVQVLKGDYSKIHLILGWKPKVQFYDGLVRVIDYIKEHMDEYQPDKYVI